MTVTEYNQCVEKYSDGLYRFILKNIKDHDKASDIVRRDTFSTSGKGNKEAVIKHRKIKLRIWLFFGFRQRDKINIPLPDDDGNGLI